MLGIARASSTFFLSITVLLTGSGSALAEEYLKYEFTGQIVALTGATPATTQRMTDAGMGIGAACRGTAYVDPDAVDENPEVNKSSYLSEQISFAIGDSAPLFEATGFQRDNYVALQQNVMIDGIPFPISGFGWAGSEPTTVSGPAFLSFNARAESAPDAGDGKGHLLALGGFAVLLQSVDLPTSLSDIEGLSLLKKLYIDVIDEDDGQSEFQIDCNLLTSSITLDTLPPVAAVPVSGHAATLLLMLLLVGTGAFLAKGLWTSSRLG